MFPGKFEPELIKELLAKLEFDDAFDRLTEFADVMEDIDFDIIDDNKNETE